MATNEDIQGLANSIASTATNNHETFTEEVREEAHKLLTRVHELFSGSSGPVSPTEAEQRAQAAADGPADINAPNTSQEAPAGPDSATSEPATDGDAAPVPTPEEEVAKADPKK